MMATKLSPPWIKLYREIQAMFKDDPQVKVLQDEYDVKVYVANAVKAAALVCLLKEDYNFGNVESHVIVIPPNDESEEDKKTMADPLFFEKRSMFEYALQGNPAMSYILDASTLFGTILYVVFANKVVQFFNDDLGDVNGYCSTLYQEIAKDIFKRDMNEYGGAVYFCTDVPESLGKPLGEWP